MYSYGKRSDSDRQILIGGSGLFGYMDPPKKAIRFEISKWEIYL